MQAPTSNNMNSSACSCGVKIVDAQPLGKGMFGLELSFPFWVDTVVLTCRSTFATRPHWLPAVVFSTGVSNVRIVESAGAPLAASHVSVGGVTAGTVDVAP